MGASALLLGHGVRRSRPRAGHEDLDPFRSLGVIAGAFNGGADLARAEPKRAPLDGQEVLLPSRPLLPSSLTAATLSLGIHEQFLPAGCGSGARRMLRLHSTIAGKRYVPFLKSMRIGNSPMPAQETASRVVSEGLKATF